MARSLTVTAVALTIGAALALYGIKHDTRAIDARAQSLERAVEKAQSDIAVLEAERAWLARPERIEELARAQGLGPIAEAQYAAVESRQDDGISELLRGPEANER